MTKDSLSETAALRALLSETSGHAPAGRDARASSPTVSWRWTSISSAVPARTSAATTV
jgi:hypothetical protein